MKVRNLTLVMIFVLILAVGVMTGVGIYMMPENVADREIERMAKEYYEDYYYDRFMDVAGEEAKDRLAEYKEEGLGIVNLRQLLYYDGGKNQKMERVFNNDRYHCDIERSEIVFYPVEPYTAKDYKVEYRLDCRKSKKNIGE